jgi:hypothetical protein
MTAHNDQRDLVIDQSHTGTVVLAALFGFLTTLLVATAALTVFWQIAGLSGWLICLFVPVVLLVLLAGQLFFNWSERALPRLWPSRRRLVLDDQGLTLSRGGRLRCQVNWEDPYTAVQWRIRHTEVPNAHGPKIGLLVLASQLRQGNNSICVFTDSSTKDWRRVPGWKQFALLEGAPRRGLDRFRGYALLSIPRNLSAPSHRGVSSMAQGDPKVLWPIEINRRRVGWKLSFEDFCAVMSAVQRSRQLREWDD